MPRVDDYMKFGCGDLVRECEGRHEYVVRGIVSNQIICTCVENGWICEFEQKDIVKVKHAGEYWSWS